MLKRLLSPFFILLILGLAVFGQDGQPPNQAQRVDGPQANDDRPNLLSQLGLSRDQVKQFRMVTLEHRPLIQAAQRRMREANRELDMAIYADTVSDEEFRIKLQAYQEAQNEVNRLRFMNELAIRKILTMDQLMRFREMRRRFAIARDRLQEIPRRLFQNKNRPAVQDRQQQKPLENTTPVRQVNRRPSI